MDIFRNRANDDNHKPDREHHPSQSAPEPVHERPGDNLLGRFADKLHLSEVEERVQPPPPPPAPEHKSLLDRLGDKLSGEDHKPPPPPKREGLFDKISDVLNGGKPEEPPKPQTFGEKIEDKLNNALGGGARGEAKEDHLDKAIDFIQEHVLKEGPQNNESAFEQAKDKQIADAIKRQFKSVTGKDFPSSKKD